MLQAECRECGAAIDVAEDVMQGEILACGDCGAELEVVSVEPLATRAGPDGNGGLGRMRNWNSVQPHPNRGKAALRRV